jgi:hypothetical protein
VSRGSVGPVQYKPATRGELMAFVELVLAWHKTIRFEALGRELCTCGVKPDECRYQQAAKACGVLKK